MYSSRSEVRLPQGLRFTDARRSTVRDFPLACSGPCASKSFGCTRLCSASRLLQFMRLPSAASLFRANLRCLLDGVSSAGRRTVREMRRCSGRKGGRSKSLQHFTLPGMPPGATAFRASRCLRNLPGPNEVGHPRVEIRSPTSSGLQIRDHAGPCHQQIGSRGPS